MKPSPPSGAICSLAKNAISSNDSGRCKPPTTRWTNCATWPKATPTYSIALTNWTDWRAPALPCSTTGHTPADLIAALHRGSEREGYYRVTRRGGGAFIAAVTPGAIRDAAGRLTGTVIVFRDVTQEREHAQKMAHQARHDALTGLVNRTEFETRLMRSLASVHEHDANHALCFIDLDGFKQVNDTGGHAAGDELLRQLGRRLAASIRHRDTLARLGGDEFGCLLDHCDQDQALHLANELLKIVNDFSLNWRGRTYRVGASIGVVEINAQSGSVTELLQAADAACYAAKASGRNQIHLHRSALGEDASAEGDAWLLRLTHALETGGLALFRQAIAPIRPGDTCRLYEMLVRLPHKEQWIPAAAFVPTAERHGLINRLDRWVVSQTLAQAPSINAGENKPAERYFINLSRRSWADPAFMDFLRAELKAQPAEPQRIVFELAETAVLGHFDEAVRFASAVKTLGFRVSLDDFADGLPMMRRLKELRLDYLKIRGELIQTIEHDAINRMLVETINRLSHTLSIQTVAKWPETPENAASLQAIGVDYLQGHIIGEPTRIDLPPSTSSLAATPFHSA